MQSGTGSCPESGKCAAGISAPMLQSGRQPSDMRAPAFYLLHNISAPWGLPTCWPMTVW